MDFGLAKLKGSMKLTRTSSTVGTLGYMAPEQIGGGDVDARSDLFSFGVLIFEMLTGRLPFKGEHEAAIIYSIMNEDPEPLTKYLPDAPPELVLLVSKSLEKDPAERYQSVSEMLVDLRRLRKSAPRVTRQYSVQQSSAHVLVPSSAGAQTSDTAFQTGTTSRISPKTGILAKIPKVGLVAVLLASAIAIILLLTLKNDHVLPSISNVRMSRLTSAGNAGYATISPDGKYVVYAKGERGEVSLWIRQVASATDVMVIPPSDVLIEGTTFSNDGNYLYYTATLPGSPVPTVYRMPVLGGAPPRKIIEDVVGSVTLSPDDGRIAFFRTFPATGVEALFVANADGSGERNLIQRDGKNLFYISQGGAPAWSPDGSVIACPAGLTTDGFKVSIVTVPLENPRDIPITETFWQDVGRIVWYPDGSGLLVCSVTEGEQSQISYVSYPGGEVSKITNDLLAYGPTSLSITRDASAIVSAQTSSSSTVMVAPAGNGARTREITRGATRQDGGGGITWLSNQQIVYSSLSGKTINLWVSDLEGETARQLSFSTSVSVTPAANTGGGEIFYVSRDEKLPHIWKMKLDGSNPVRITESEDYNPEVSHDGKWLLFDSWKSGTRSLWRLQIDGKDTATLFCASATRPKISPDGRFVLCRYYDEAEKRDRMGLLSFPDGKLLSLFDLPLTASANAFQWAPDGKSVHYVDTRKGISNVWAFDYAKNSTRQVSTFTSGRIFAFAWSPDGRNLAVAHGQTTSDVVLLTMTK